MNCNDFEAEIHTLSRKRLTDFANQFRIHAESCDRCAERWTEKSALALGIDCLSSAIAQEEPSAQVEGILLAEFRNEFACTGQVTSLPSRVNWRQLSRITAVAASILIILGASVYCWRYFRTRTETDDEIIAVPLPPAVEQATAGTNVAPANIVTKHRSQRAHRATLARLRHSQTPAEQVTEFFPLMIGVDLDSMEAARMVRVELPASELRNFGLAIGPELSTAPVKADVVLGYDGQARAIRFVH